MQSSKATNILLAIIALCLIVIAMKPAGILPDASAQIDRMSDRDAADRFTGITASDKAVQQQVQAINAIARSIDGVAQSGQEISKSLDGLSRAVLQVGSQLAESRMAGAAAGASP
jgi:hypothetical protein